jgi:hypothetical protein
MPITHAIQGGMWLLIIWKKKIGITEGIHSLNLLDENNPEGVQKPSQKNHLPINGACVGMLIETSKTFLVLV